MEVEELVEAAKRRMLPPPKIRRAIREAAGVRRSEVAEVCGVTWQAVSHWESGRNEPSGINRDRYAELLRSFTEVAG